MTATPVQPISVVVAGGGTAGHIEPAMAVADALRAKDDRSRITALGTARGLESDLIPARGYELQLINPVPVPRKLNADLFKLPFRVLKAVQQTKKVLDDSQADVLIGFGGYVSAPAYIAAKLAKRKPKMFVHEANARAGLANKLGTWLGGTALAAVPGSGLKADVVGIPVRRTITEMSRSELRAEAREYFGLPADGPVLLVSGGSQGAQSLNNAVLGAQDALSDAGIAVLHGYGKKNEVTVTQRPGGAPYVALPYIDRMDLAYAAADLMVCRAGAMTVAEVSATGLPAVYVPLPHGNGEQELNARPVVDAGGGIIVKDSDLTPERLAEVVIPFVTNSEALAESSRAAALVGHRGAADHIADLIFSAAEGAAQ